MNDDASSPDETAARWLEFTRRMAIWNRDNPGAYPSERADFEARLRWELGL
jgi:hypothetical protein